MKLKALLCWALLGWSLGASTAGADSTLHCLWEIHGKHNTVYLLGSIHTLRASDYPLAPAVLEAYRGAKSLVMEIDPNELDSAELQSEMLASATLTDGKNLHDIMGTARYAHAEALAREVGLDLSTFDQFAPWFVAEAISQMQLMQLGFDPSSGVEMYFSGRARTDGKSIAGLETGHDQLALFEGMPMETQANYLISSLEQAHDLTKEVNEMVRAWQSGDMSWFETEMKSDLGRDPAVYQSLLVSRNRKWIARIEKLLDDDENHLVIVGTAHLVGRDSVIDLLKKDGIGAVQR
ncbi:MAG: TraB/GumN family protein [Steroidobacteraceae bacterium]